MTFRGATPDDAERIVRFWHEAGASMGPTDSVEHVRRAVVHPGALLLLAEAEGAIAGTLLGSYDGWRGNMHRLVVDPARRRLPFDPHIVRHVGTMRG